MKCFLACVAAFMLAFVTPVTADTPIDVGADIPALVEILDGKAVVDGEIIFVAVDDQGNVELYCVSEKPNHGGLTGRVVREADQSYVLSSPCWSPASWRSRQDKEG